MNDFNRREIISPDDSTEFPEQKLRGDSKCDSQEGERENKRVFMTYDQILERIKADRGLMG